MEVYNTLGPGFLEAVYQEALEIEFKARAIPFAREVPLKIAYKGQSLRKEYVADFICFDEIIVETKATAGLASEHAAQVLNYLKATGKRLGLLVNFGNGDELQWSRLLNPMAGDAATARRNAAKSETDSSNSEDSFNSRLEGCGDASPRTERFRS